MIYTYCAALLVLTASAVIGQAAFSLCGRWRLSSLAPVVGLALVLALAWRTVRLPGEGATAAAIIGLLTLVCAAYLWRTRRWSPDRAESLSVAVLVGVCAILLASLPFVANLRFGILGTGLNPDMSQHLFAASQLAVGGSERLIETGYPLGPHALVAALDGLGIGFVQGFNGLTVAVAVIACWTPLTMLRSVGPRRRVIGAVLVGFCYLLAAGLVQGSFKEMIEAVFVLATGVAAWQLGRGRLLGPSSNPLLLGVPFALISIGVVYAYSFPGLLWVFGGLAVWALVEGWLRWRSDGRDRLRAWVSTLLPGCGVAAGLFLFIALPEAPRMVEFGGFETFAPAGAGLGNLFEPLSPFLALGVWPSGDFRVEPGGGAAPAAVFVLGVALALWVLFNGVRADLRERQYALVSMAVAALLLWGYAGIVGTPYQAAKALLILAPLVMLISVTGFIGLRPGGGEWWRQLLRAPVALLFVLAAAGSSLLILGSGPVGPSKWSPLLNEIRPLDAPALVVGSFDFMEDDNGRELTTWELRGGYVCTKALGPPDSEYHHDSIPAGVGYLVAVNDGDNRPPMLSSTGSEPPILERVTGDDVYTVWRITNTEPTAQDPCPFVPDGPNTGE